MQGHHRLKAIRLLGRQPVEAIEDERVATIFVASQALYPGDENPFNDLESDISFLKISQYELEVMEQWPNLASLQNADRGREILIDLVDQSIKRLDEILKIHAEKADATAERTFNRLHVDATPEGKSLRAHKSKCMSAYYRGLAACEKFKKGRKAEGGGRKDEIDSSWMTKERLIPTFRRRGGEGSGEGGGDWDCSGGDGESG